MLDVEVWDVKGVLVELLVLQARGHVLHLLHFPRTEHMRAVVHTHRTVLGGTCTNNISLKSNHKYVASGFFLCVFKKTQGQPKKTQGPFGAKNSTCPRLCISDFTKKNFKKIHIQTTVFHEGDTFKVIFITIFLFLGKKV